MFFRRKKQHQSKEKSVPQTLHNYWITDIRGNTWIQSGYSSADALEKARTAVRNDNRAIDARGFLGSNNSCDPRFAVTRYYPQSAILME